MFGIRLMAVWLLAAACCLAQKDEKKLLERVLAKPDMALMNPMNEKKFDGGGFLLKKPYSGTSAFLYDQKAGMEKYRGVRSFLGLKNPWFGKRLYESNQADVWTKSLLLKSDTEYPTKKAKTEQFYHADKRAYRREEPVKAAAYQGRGSSQERLDRLSEKIDKNLTVEQVREILNKNR